jgi:hypothetical protein
MSGQLRSGKGAYCQHSNRLGVVTGIAGERGGYVEDHNTRLHLAGDSDHGCHEHSSPLPALASLQPFVLGGGGALIFNPTGNSGGTLAGAVAQPSADIAFRF